MLFTVYPRVYSKAASRSLKLILQRCHEYTSQTPALLVDTPRLRLLKLIEVGLNGEQLDNLLKSAPTGMMQTLEVIMTPIPAPETLRSHPCRPSVLTSLSLSNNGITDFAFLPSLEHSGLNEIPSFLSVVFPELAELNLASNIIQQLEPSRLANLSRLVRLDLSGNQIQTLSDDWRRLQPPA
uniref:Leucine-rich repeat domain-containing protein n=1 Tax=Macrostomum lignano TaxID=282301 RepID=A0A1I8FSG6_9PLAT